MSAFVTCFLSCPLSSNKGQMIRGGTAAPSTAFFRTSRTTTVINKSPMKVSAIVTAGPDQLVTAGPDQQLTVNEISKWLDVEDHAADYAVIGTPSPNMKVVADDDNELVLAFHWPGVLSKDNIKHHVSKDYNYLILEGKVNEDGAGKNASGSLMWWKSIAYDTHFRLPEDWDKSSEIKAQFDATYEVMIIRVAKSKGLDDGDLVEWE